MDEAGKKHCCSPERTGAAKTAGNAAHVQSATPTSAPPPRLDAPAAETDGGEFVRVRAGSTAEMKLIPAGEFLMGTDGTYGFEEDGERPAHPIRLDAFWIDATCVTNEQFNRFVNATGYRTDADRFGWSFVFYGLLAPKQRATLDPQRVVGTEWWCRIDGANWRHPEGVGSSIKDRWDHPVVHVSWSDARAYAAWVGKRLPTEAEWECAARGGLVQQRYPWGSELEPEGRHRMNVWQGRFPHENTCADGHYGTAPAKSFRANGHGLYNMTGNVWEWCWDWFDSGYYRVSPAANPAGPMRGERRVLRGGSFLCHASYCNRYRTDARSHNTPDSSASNIGFRCVRDVQPGEG
jgi:formylglycine-generating enzyme required for sulfatase activity